MTDAENNAPHHAIDLLRQMRKMNAGAHVVVLNGAPNQTETLDALEYLVANGLMWRDDAMVRVDPDDAGVQHDHRAYRLTDNGRALRNRLEPAL